MEDLTTSYTYTSRASMKMDAAAETQPARKLIHPMKLPSCKPLDSPLNRQCTAQKFQAKIRRLRITLALQLA